jgi:large subunit ribosomal protein L22
MAKQKQVGTEHIASARSLNLPISTKHSVEISHQIRYKNTSFARKFLEDVISMEKAVPFRRFRRDVGHKRGMSAGRFPQKAAKEFLKLVKSVEANAQTKGLNTTTLKITKLVANKASTPITGGRLRQGTKRTHLEIQVKERKEIKKDKTGKRSAVADKLKEVGKKTGPTVPEVKKEKTSGASQEHAKSGKEIPPLNDDKNEELSTESGEESDEAKPESESILEETKQEAQE